VVLLDYDLQVVILVFHRRLLHLLVHQPDIGCLQLRNPIRRLLTLLLIKEILFSSNPPIV
jgi:hypothetical protein